jgi:hypothetical protein
MQAAAQRDYITVANYLAAEERSEVRHEYLGGMVYATSREAVCFRRANGWRAERITFEQTSLSLKSIELSLPMSAIYEGT